MPDNNFVLNNINTILGYGAFKLLDSLVLPLGISFWTFQQVTYLVDIYKNRIKPEKSFLVYATYIFFFPQLIAGPICWVFFRAHNVHQALSIIGAMFQFKGIGTLWLMRSKMFILVLLVVVCKFIPETFELVRIGKNKRTAVVIVISALLMIYSLYLMNTVPSEFLYFQF